MSRLILNWLVYWGWTFAMVLAAVGLASHYTTRHGRVLRLSLACGSAWAIGGIGALAWMGHLLDRPEWYTWVFDLPPMAPNTAMALVLIGVALLLVVAVLRADEEDCIERHSLRASPTTRLKPGDYGSPTHHKEII